MSVNNFIGTIWKEGFIQERTPKFNGIAGCVREYEGLIKNKGDKVKIKAIGDITVNDYTRNPGSNLALQKLDDESMMIEVTQAKYYNFMVDSVDAAQADSKLMKEAMRKAGLKQNSLADKFIYSMYGDAGKVITDATFTSAKVKALIAQGLQALYENDVPEGTEIRLEVSPAIYTKLLLAKIVSDTNNSGVLKNGKVGNFMGCDIYLSNNLTRIGNADKCLMRTTDAIAYVEQMTEIQAGDLGQAGFGDYVKGLMLYGAKVIRPKELICLDLTPAAEA